MHYVYVRAAVCACVCGKLVAYDHVLLLGTPCPPFQKIRNGHPTCIAGPTKAGGITILCRESLEYTTHLRLSADFYMEGVGVLLYYTQLRNIDLKVVQEFFNNISAI